VPKISNQTTLLSLLERCRHPRKYLTVATPSPGGEDIDGRRHHLQTAKQPRGSDPNADSGNVAAKRGNHPLPKHVALPYWEVVPQQPANVLGPGQALCIPRGAIHRFDNNESRDVKALCVITPAAIGPQYFREAAEVINAAAGGQPNRAQMVEIMRRHGLIPAPPQA
jgi:hypothetical protein